jgi:hypothetical protein
MKKLILGSIFLLSTIVISAQTTTNDLVELLKSDLKNNRKAVITEVMNFTEAESQVFWPIYREYEFEMEKLADQRLSVIKQFAENYETLSNEKADELMNSYFDFMEDRLSLNKKYYNKYADVLAPTVAAKYMQLENEIQLIIDTEVASAMPYFKKVEIKDKK